MLGAFTVLKKYYRDAIRVSNSFDPDQVLKIFNLSGSYGFFDLIPVYLKTINHLNMKLLRGFFGVFSISP